MSKPWLTNWKPALYISAVAVGFLTMHLLQHIPHGPEHWSADLRTALMSPRLKSQHPKIALVLVGERTLANHPYVSPTDRKLLADLVRAIDAAGAKAIGIDFIFDRQTEPAKDQTLIEAIRSARAPVILGAIGETAMPGATGKSFQTRFIEAAGRPAGHLYLDELHSGLVISDNVIRLIARPPKGHDTAPKQSFAELIAAIDGRHPQPRSRYISWLRPPSDGTDTFLSLPAEHVLGTGGLARPLPLREQLGGRLVLIGGNFPDRDQHLTPLSVTSHSRSPGVFIHAQIIAQLIDERSLRTLGWQLLLIALVLSAGGGFWVGRTFVANHLIIELASVVGFVLIGILAFALFGLIFPYTSTVLAWLVGATGGYFMRPRH